MSQTHYIEEIRILCLVQSPEHVDSEAFPSWVHDWRASSETLKDDLHDRTPASGYRATRDSVLDYDPSSNDNELHLYGIPIGTLDQAGRCDNFHSSSIFNLGNRYDGSNQPITVALRQAQALNTNVTHERIGIKHLDWRSLADFPDIPMKTRFRRLKCNQCPMAHTMPILAMEKSEQNPALYHIHRGCSRKISSKAVFRTDARYFGFGLNRTAVGDQIFFLLVQAFHSSFDRPVIISSWSLHDMLMELCTEKGSIGGSKSDV